MKMNGQVIAANFVHPFTLNRICGHPLTFQLRPLPLGFQNLLRQRGFFPPTPPVKVSRDATGKPLRDATGLAVTQVDTSDHRYLADLELHHQRIAVIAIIESLKEDDEILFESTLASEDAAGWRDYADQVFREFEEAGLTIGDLIALCDEICRISNLTDQHLITAQANFSSSRPTGST